jgi:hypothetical protein
MSTPTRRFPHSTELSYVPHWARESLTGERDADESEPRDASAARARTDSELWPGDANARDPLDRLDDTLARPTLVPNSYFARDARESRHGATPLQDVHPGSDSGEQPAAPVDVDLGRLETALHWLQREAAARRFPSPSLLEAERRPPPPATAARHALRWLVTVLVGAAVAAPLAYFVSPETTVSASTRVAPLQRETFQRRFDSPQVIRQETVSIGRQQRDPGTSFVPSISPRQADVPSTAPAPAVKTVALATPQQTDAATAAASRPVRVLDREEIALLVGQGEQLIATGDIAAARIVFQRASEAGDAAATVALAASYDPTVLTQIGVVGKHADLKKARGLYEKAESLGWAEATRRLQVLAR